MVIGQFACTNTIVSHCKHLSSGSAQGFETEMKADRLYNIHRMYI